MKASPSTLVDRLHDAINRHDLESFVNCFAADYQSEQPAHPNRVFTGREQVRKNWAAIFASVPDLQSELLRTAKQDETIWSEWHWHGHREDGTTLDMRGVILLGERDDQIAWGRLYMEDTELDGKDIDATVQEMTTAQSADR